MIEPKIQKFANMIVPNPCNKAMEDRNWDALRTIMEYLDQIFNIEIVNNELVFNLVNITEITVYDVTVTNNVTINNNLTVVNNVTIEQSLTVVENVFVENNLTVTNDISVTNVYVTTVESTTINTYQVTMTYIYDNDGNSLCPPDCGGGGGGGGGGTGCDSLPSTLYMTFDLCGSYTITLTEYTDPITGADKAWEGSGTVGDGTMQVRVWCSEGQMFYAIDACTGSMPAYADIDNPDLGFCSTAGAAADLPYSATTAPASACDNNCMSAMGITLDT